MGRQLAVATLVLLLVGCSGGGREISIPEPEAQQPNDELRTPPILQEFAIGGDFTLTDHHGEPFVLSEHRGELFLLFFGYTACPDFCPNTLARLAEAYELLGPPAQQVTTLFVTVDPERDTPEQLSRYLDLFGIPALGLTGSDTALREVAQAYAARYEREATESAAGALFAHTTYTYLIDGAGKVRYTFRHNDTARFIAAGIEQLLERSLDGAAGEI